MSIIREQGSLVASCDSCPITEDLEAGDFAEARRELADLGWTLTFDEGEWNDLCPACAEALDEPRGPMPWEKKGEKK